MKIQIWAGLCVFAIIIAGCGRAGSYFDQAETGTQESLSTEVSTQAGTGWQAGQEKECYVYVCGAVVQPGVYKLPAKSRIYEAIQMAGTFLIILPLLIVYFCLQRQFIEGIEKTGITGE